MTPHDFLAAVLPNTGLYCVVGISKGSVKQYFFDSLDTVVECAAALDKKKIDAYFAVASFDEEQSRKSEHAVGKQALYLDVDCGEGKPYSNWRAGIDALADFLIATQLPQPMVVRSGRGIHVYWPLHEPVQPAAWRRAAVRLAALCERWGFHADPTVTTDVVRVLRIPDTHNWKDPANPRPVHVLCRAADKLTLAEFSDIAKEGLNGHDVLEEPSLGIEGTRPEAVSPLTLADNHSASFKTILRKTMAGEGCEQLRHYVEHAAEEGMEPLWRGVLSLAKACDEGVVAARKMSELHPYTEERMQIKLAQIKGPYNCETFNTQSPGICPNCPNYKKIKNPIKLGHYVKEAPPVAKEVVMVDASVPALIEPQSLVRPQPPFGYFYGEHGGVYKRGSDEEMGAAKLVVPYDLFVANVGHSELSGKVNIVSVRHGVTKIHSLSSSAMISKDETLKALASENIMASVRSSDVLLHDYLRAAIGDRQKAERDVALPSSFGWQENGSFVLGNTRYTAQGPMPVSFSAELVNLAAITQPRGTVETWRAIMSLFIVKKRYDILFGALTGFGSPLMEFTGYTGCAVHLQSHRSGTGKSVALALAASAFGHPTESRVSVESSSIATIHRMGLARSLVIPIDEVTKKTRAINGANPSWMSEFLLSVTEGKGKERIDGSTITERRNTTRWKLLALLSSNTSLVDGLASASHSVEGEINRLIEINVDTPLHLTPQEEALLSKLDRNYGYSGINFITWVTQNVETTKQIVNAAKARAVELCGLSGPERYWLACITAILAARTICSSEYANVIDIPQAPLEAFIKEVIDKQRHVRKDSDRTAKDILLLFLKENYPNLLVMRKVEGGLSTTLGLSDVAEDTPTRAKVRGRIERGFVPNYVSVFIDKRALQQHCYTTAFNSTAFVEELSKHYIVTTERKNLFAHTKAGSAPRVLCVRIDIPEGDWEEPVVDGTD